MVVRKKDRGNDKLLQVSLIFSMFKNYGLSSNNSDFTPTSKMMIKLLCNHAVLYHNINKYLVVMVVMVVVVVGLSNIHPLPRDRHGMEYLDPIFHS